MISTTTHHADWKNSASICKSSLSWPWSLYPRRRVQWLGTQSRISEAWLLCDIINVRCHFEINQISWSAAHFKIRFLIINVTFFCLQNATTADCSDDAELQTYRPENDDDSFRNFLWCKEALDRQKPLHKGRGKQKRQFSLKRIVGLAILVMLLCCECKCSIMENILIFGQKGVLCHVYTLESCTNKGTATVCNEKVEIFGDRFSFQFAWDRNIS